MNALMTFLADHQCFSLPRRHDLLPFCLRSSPRTVDVRQLTDVMELYRPFPFAKLASPGHQPLNDFRPFAGRLEPRLRGAKVHHPHAFWNPLEGNTPERGNQWLPVRSFDDDLKRFAVKDAHAILLADLGQLALELCCKRLRQ